MTKKRDPIVAVLDYFEHAELPVANQALALAKEIVRKRTPLTKARPKKSAAKNGEVVATT